ncbi:ATP-dependent helicase/deoxyribonuclease subunit B [Streptococcus canis]|uniref:ATP-dependent helicase/deoxyribonuclease subunit B n=1 Tax=Streptococcus canis TaxID=1329 RepID=A0A3P5XNE5_STRCB|nr:ATP-dependent nuclease subunit B [Streptococcus canis]MDV5972684.1 ATP-dependent nuclease subunit B [Streptococcus canis]QKG77305.1 ATP-dependent nuclease subunit B [Streptococcus canis]VDC41924.1 ATP-dependent helicase/deoxyribonuclease subunit B [Streptococcus canis]
MKLIYTEMAYSMTEILVGEARQAAHQGYRVFYLAPNSLSFEKEREVLTLLPERGSFSITVTRFAQMARYFTFTSSRPKQHLDDMSLAMIFYRALMTLGPEELPVYGRLKDDHAFVKQLVDLYKELQTAHISVYELTDLDTPEKQGDLIKIISLAEHIMAQQDYNQDTSLMTFARAIEAGLLNDQLANTVIIIDGFSRFSAEEEYLLSLLNDTCQAVVIGSYISQKAYQKSFIKGNIYEASRHFLQDLAQKYQTKPVFAVSEQTFAPAFSRLTQLVEANHDFSQLDWQLQEEDKASIHLWQSPHQKEEIEHVAKAIREKLYQGYRYKDILVLLGDVEAYQLQIGPIFDKFEIPYYLGKAEPMTAHPLVQFIESLERSLRYNWRREDILNLLKSGLFGTFTDQDIDRFEEYLQFADIKGFTKFSRPFTINSSRHYPLELLNVIREAVFSPLQTLFKSQKQLGASLIDKLMAFFKVIQLSENMKNLGQSQLEIEKNEEVWKTFSDSLTSCYQIFGQEKLKLADCLALIKMGMQSAHYRVVPATLDVVSVKSYDLVQPHSKPFVYAIGLTQSHFPKQVTTTGLLSDQERVRVNESLNSYQHFDIASAENSQKNHQTALSLFNAATKELVLSVPTVVNELSDDLSPYLKELMALGLPLLDKGKNWLSYAASDIGNYKALLSRVIDIDRQAILADMTDQDKTFWTVALRYLKRRLREKQLTLPTQDNHLATKTLAPQVIEARFPSNRPLNLSSTALTVFYNNQYKYFLQYVLGLQEAESIHPDARIHGQYLHRVFELVMKDQTAESFDNKLTQAIHHTNQEHLFQQVYQNNAEARYSLDLLEDIAKSTASILRLSQNVKVISQEKSFELNVADQVLVHGVIDRIDQLDDGSLGVVDYKSSASQFDIGTFYNGLSSQLITYLAVLQQQFEPADQEHLFGAMYLHLQDPKMDLSAFKTLDDKLVESLYKALTYKGIFLENEKEHLATGAYQTRNALYSVDELQTLLAYNNHLYLKAAEHIKKGHFLINPYTSDGKSVQGDQLKAITRFEADLDLGQARRLLTLPARNKRDNFLSLMREEDNL